MQIGYWISLGYYNSSCSFGTIYTAQVTQSYYWIESCYRVCDPYFPVATGLSHRRFAELVHPPLGVHSLMTTGQRPTKMQPTNRAKLHPPNNNIKFQFRGFVSIPLFQCVFICNLSIDTVILINMHEVARPAVAVLVT